MDKYVRAQGRIAEGLWSVDAESGQVHNSHGRAIGSVMVNGYIFLSMSPVNGGRSNQNVYAHRVIWESVHGRIADGLQVNHINGDKSDNRIANLELVTPSGNALHAASSARRSAAADRRRCRRQSPARRTHRARRAMGRITAGQRR